MILWIWLSNLFIKITPPCCALMYIKCSGMLDCPPSCCLAWACPPPSYTPCLESWILQEIKPNTTYSPLNILRIVSLKLQLFVCRNWCIMRQTNFYDRLGYMWTCEGFLIFLNKYRKRMIMIIITNIRLTAFEKMSSKIVFKKYTRKDKHILPCFHISECCRYFVLVYCKTDLNQSSNKKEKNPRGFPI